MVRRKKPAKVLKVPSRNPAGRPKDIEKHTAILVAASEYFMHLGFELTSMDAIAKAAGVSKLTIYSHFEDKDSLFKAVIQSKCKEYNVPHYFIDYSAMPVVMALQVIGNNLISLILSDEAICMHRIIEAESHRHPKISALFYEAGPKPVEQGIGELFMLWNKQGKLRIPDVELAVDHFLCLMKGGAHMKMLLNIAKRPSASKIKKHVESGVMLFSEGYKVK